jgi:hypothetical protein
MQKLLTNLDGGKEGLPSEAPIPLVLPPLSTPEKHRGRARTQSAQLTSVLGTIQHEGDKFTKKIEIEKTRLEETERSIKAAHGTLPSRAYPPLHRAVTPPPPHSYCQFSYSNCRKNWVESTRKRSGTL